MAFLNKNKILIASMFPYGTSSVALRLHIKTKLFIVLCAIFLLSPITINAKNNEVIRIIRKVDNLYKNNSSISEIEIKIKTPYWTKIADLKIWKKGKNKTFIRIFSPEREAGSATLSKGNDMWNYFPRINNIVKIHNSMMLGSWFGSDFTNNDIVKKITYEEAYNIKFIYPKNFDKKFHYLSLLPKKSVPSVWGKIIMKIKKTDEIPREISFFRNNNYKVKIMTFSNIKTIEGKKIPTKITLRSIRKKRSTVLTYKKINFNSYINNKIFTFENFKRASHK